MEQKVTKPKILEIVIFLAILCLFFIGLVISLILFDHDSDNMALYSQIHIVASKIKKYKLENGHFPRDLTEVNSPDQICTTNFQTVCRKLFYKPSEDLQDFRMAMPTFSGTVLFYHPEVSFSIEAYHLIPKTERERMFEKYQLMCFTCLAHKFTIYDLFSSSGSDPVYRRSSPIFSNPFEWPEI